MTPAQLRKFDKYGLESVGDLLYLAPRRLGQWGQLTDLSNLVEEAEVTVIAQVVDAHTRSMRNRSGAIFTAVLSDGKTEITATFFGKHPRALAGHERALTPGSRHLFAGKVSQYRGKWQLTHPQYDAAEELSEAEAAKRAQKPFPIYPATAKLPSWVIARTIKTFLASLAPETLPEVVPNEYRQQAAKGSTWDALHALHDPKDVSQWHWARKRLAFDEALIAQAVLAQNRLAREEHPAPALLPKENGLFDSIVAHLPWELTSAQTRVIAEISQALESTTPLSRLLQGDVGSGKTVVALLAMARAIDAGKQAALLAPTEVLAAQHLRTLQNLLGDLAQGGTIFAQDGSVKLALLTGNLPMAQKRQVLADLASGQPMIVVGTHALLSEQVQLPNLGLAVVDEQHRFGVEQRDALTLKDGLRAHTLVMTATPIPRTVAMTVFGDLDVSILDAAPAQRAKVTTHLVSAENQKWVERIWERASEEIRNGGHVYVVCPRIDANDLSGEDNLQTLLASSGELAAVETVAAELAEQPALAGIDLVTLHGRMSSAEKNQAMADFKSGAKPLMVATSVIEVGVDDPQATMMVILDAQQFGLSALHQLRGRIGRGNRPGLCLAVYATTNAEISLQRLNAFAQTTDGFELAQADLELRAEGDVLGVEQSGHRSRLRFLSVRKDEEIISQAREVAGQIVAADPTLANYPDLRAAIESQLDEAERANLQKS
ncbi:hypothetical protein BK816_05550 [Boudabousia tangfeifanii]|uniref:Probable DNA 3'-5' helicase RecG n=2 Tax=Boudabousia tangfeifanii TaxID=1912795 RepID=A0A1D9MKK2_9ACTO|nr:hypothetical protein BK816_05550 [Boudabousia tangfeifanii]